MKARSISAVAFVGLAGALGAYAAAMGIGPSSIVGGTSSTVQAPAGASASCESIFGSSCCLEGGLVDAAPTTLEPGPTTSDVPAPGVAE